MRILLISGSPRANGNTMKILKLCERAMGKTANEPDTMEFEYISIANMKLKPCRGCRACFDYGEKHCPCNDGLLEVKVKMEGAGFGNVNSIARIEK